MFRQIVTFKAVQANWLRITPSQTTLPQITPPQITPPQITPSQITPPQITPPQITPLRWALSRAALLGITLLTPSLLSGCVRVTSPQIEFSLEVESAGQPGEYQLSGKTNLPDRTKVTVQALRVLTSPKQGSPNYSILGREVVEVAQGQWRTSLRIWQVDEKGKYQETWQAIPKFAKGTQVDPKITFMAITDPGNQPANLDQQLQDLGKRLEGDKIFFDPQGRWYAQVQDARPVALPSGGTSAPSPEPNGVKTKLDVRQQVATTKPEDVPKAQKPGENPQLPAPKDQERQIDAPLRPQEMLR
jgi:hypothetical protein